MTHAVNHLQDQERVEFDDQTVRRVFDCFRDYSLSSLLLLLQKRRGGLGIVSLQEKINPIYQKRGLWPVDEKFLTDKLRVLVELGLVGVNPAQNTYRLSPIGKLLVEHLLITGRKMEQKRREFDEICNAHGQIQLGSYGD